MDQFLIRPEDVAHYYGRGRADIPRPEPRAWLEEYKDLYEEEMRARRDLAERPPQAPHPHEDEPYGGEPPRTLPFERGGARVGRNDPCPCGSGKKYKNCHMKLEARK